MALDSGSLTGLVQQGLVAFQSTTQLEWWAALSVSTLCVRVSLFPLIRQQIIASTKLSVAIPEISFLYKLLKQRLSAGDLKTRDEKLKIIKVFFNGVNSCMKIHDVSAIELMIYPAMNVTLFILFILSLRDFVGNAPASFNLEDGGILWFKDLTSKDESLFLPLTAVSLTYLNLDNTFGAGKSNRFFQFLRDFTQSTTLLMLPFTSTLPAGVFCYWITNSTYTLIQAKALGSPAFRELLRLPQPPAPPQGNSTPQ